MKLKQRHSEEYTPGISVLHCGVCGVEVARWHPEKDFAIGRDEEPGDLDLTRFNLVMESVDEECRHHLEEWHPTRYRLWKRLRWNWLVGGLGH